MAEYPRKLRPIDFFMWIAVVCIVMFSLYKVNHTLYWGQKSKNWPTTKGLITESYRTNYGSRGGAYATVRYSYSVESKKYTSDSISFYDSNKMEWLERYPNGSLVTVYYDPELHSRSVLEPGADLETSLSGDFLMHMALCSVLVLFLLTGYGRKWNFPLSKHFA